ncbi:MAG: helix-turn-helix transcriptional regulator [Alphaproteobacteria bacterium]|nr:helix-turn-helix transcriptional regulator [Alphaproteobacteria bacterium]
MKEEIAKSLQAGERLYGPMTDEITYRMRAGERLQAARLALGYKSGKDFADATGVAESALSDWEKGSDWVSPWYVSKLRKLYGIDHNWLYDGSLVELPDSLFRAIHGLDKGK